MKLELLKEWDNGGDVLKPEDYSGKFLVIEDDDVCKRLIEDGIAKQYTSDHAKKVEVRVGESETLTADDVEGLVNQTLNKAASQTARKPIHQDDGVKQDPIDKDGQEGFDSAGEFMLQVRKWRKGIHTEKMRKYINKFTAGHYEEGLDIQGGFLVPEEYRRQLLEIMHEEGRVTSRCQQVPVAGQVVKIPAIDESSRAAGSRYGGTRAYQVGEAEQYTLSNSKFSMIKLEPEKRGVISYASDEFEEDSAFGVGQLIMRLMGKELAFVMDDDVINGNGASQALGVLNAPATVSQAKETGQAAGTIVFENIVNMWARMHARSRGNAVWFINQDCEPQLFTMALSVGTGGVPAYMPANGLSDSPFASLMGRPVIPIEQCATLGTVGDILLCDMSQYLLAVKGGVRSAVSEHLRFDYDQNVYKASIRFDGQPWWKTALTPFKGSNTQSPFVSLATRS